MHFIVLNFKCTMAIEVGIVNSGMFLFSSWSLGSMIWFECNIYAVLKLICFSDKHAKIRTKGQLISIAIYGLLTSLKKQMDEFVLFAFLLFTANKSNSSVRFLGESMAHQSAFWFYLTFSQLSSYVTLLKNSQI